MNPVLFTTLYFLIVIGTVLLTIGLLYIPITIKYNQLQAIKNNARKLKYKSI